MDFNGTIMGNVFGDNTDQLVRMDGMNVRVRVFGPLGNLVLETSTNNFDLSGNTPGLYRIEVVENGQRPTFRSLILVSDK